MVKASVRSLTSSPSFIAWAAFFTASESAEHGRGWGVGGEGAKTVENQN